MLLYILFDLISVLFAFSIIIINCRLSFFHPGAWLLIFHLFVNSLRYFAVYSGAPLLDFYDLKGPNIYEFNHAFFWSDIALISSAIFIVIAEKKKYPLPYIKE